MERRWSFVERGWSFVKRAWTGVEWGWSGDGTLWSFMELCGAGIERCGAGTELCEARMERPCRHGGSREGTAGAEGTAAARAAKCGLYKIFLNKGISVCFPA